MERKLIADVCPDETRIALLDDGHLSELQVETHGQERLVGNIYKGKVANVLPGMQAAFVDIGLDKNGFLYAGDVVGSEDAPPARDARKEHAPKIKDVLKQHQEVLVQVLKQPGGTKGARLTTKISLPGRFVVLTPTMENVTVSRRIQDAETRSRLKKLGDKIRPEGMGLVLRTAAAEATEQQIEAEVQMYAAQWRRIQEKAEDVHVPSLVHAEESLLFRVVRDVFTEDVAELVINDQDSYDRVCAQMALLDPKLRPRVRYYSGMVPIFDAYALEDRMDRLLQRKVWLRNGAYLVIDETEALTVIDVNTGKYTGRDDLQQTILETNLEAAEEIARQIRLRDLSGIIIVDFIDMTSEASRREVLGHLEEAVRSDPVRTQVLGMTQLGLVEMTRKRTRKRLSALLETTCPHCGGSGRVPNVDTLMRRVRIAVLRHMENAEPGDYLIEVPKAVADRILTRNAQGVSLLPEYRGTQFHLRAVPERDPAHLQIRTVTGRAMLEGTRRMH